MINYEQFSQIKLRVVTVKEAYYIEGSEKLLKLIVNDGNSEHQIIAGIGKVYEPENLVGKQIVIVANLEPRVLMGKPSDGMLLAADSSDGPVLLIPEKPVADGAKVR